MSDQSVPENTQVGTLTIKMEYNPMLQDLLFETTADSFIAKLGKRRDLVTLTAFKDIDSLAPALSISEREKLYEFLIHSSSLPFIPSFNVRGIEVELPENIYEILEEIEIDELNLSRILVMMRHKVFPNLQSLTIYTEGDIVFPVGEMKNLRSLSLYNLTNEIRTLPDMNDLALERLSLSGYMLEFQGILPKRLKLEQCYIHRSSGLQGCESMVLFHTRWDTLSFPTRSLSIESGQLTSQPPSTLESLTLVTCKLRNISFSAIEELTGLRLDRCEGSVKIEHRLEISSLTINLDYLLSTDSRIPDSVTTLRLNSRSHSHTLGAKTLKYPSRLLVLELYECIVDLYGVLGDLPRSVSQLTVIRCTIHSQRLIESARFPSDLRTLHFMGCEADNMYPTIPGTLEELVVIGRQPGVYGEAQQQMLCLTSVFMMDLVEFRLFCIDRLHRGQFKEFEDYYRDIVQASRWITRDMRHNYLAVLMAYPFQISLPSDMLITKGVLKHANEDMSIKLGRHNHTIKYIRELIRQAREEDLEIGRLDRELQSVIEKALA